MKTISNKALVITLVILNVLVLGGFAFFTLYNHSTVPPTFAGQQLESSSRHTIYLGTTDPQGNPLPLAETKAQMATLCEKYVKGYTVLTGQGFWTNALNAKVREDNLVYVLYNAQDDQVEALLEEAAATFLQSSILMEKSTTNTLFYTPTP